MKIAITGKGGVGKTTIAALLAVAFDKAGYSVFAIDADPDANLALTLGFPNPSEITPIIEMKSLIEERMGTAPGNVGAYFKLNPKVDDIPDTYSAVTGNIKLLVMGTISQANEGCACAENAFVRELMNHLLTERDEVVILDMEAGIEHLGRGTAQGVEAMLIVVEPSIQSIETAKRIHRLAEGLKIQNIWAVSNKIGDPADLEVINERMRRPSCLCNIPYTTSLRNKPLIDYHLFDNNKNVIEEIHNVRKYIEERLGSLSGHRDLSTG